MTPAEAWGLIDTHAATLAPRRILDLFAEDPGRIEAFTIAAPHLRLDLSKEKLDERAVDALLALAAATDLEGWRARMFAGEIINTTERRAVRHAALRAPSPPPEIAETRARMAAFAADFREGRVKGAGGAALNAIVHIGIGGSDLGPRLLYDALKEFRASGVTLRFAGNVDGAEIDDALEGLDPQRTLIAVVSKTFTTLETMTNAETARAWLRAGLSGREDVGDHFVAVSAAPEKAAAWGVRADRVFPFWDYVGGRYSLWSAVGLSAACALKPGAFEALLAGAAEMDAHFRDAPLRRNAPVMAAFVHLWNRAALNAASYVCAPYARRLQLLPAFLQQLEMESNGKRVTREGETLVRLAAGVTWGEPGTNSQHSFFQLLHQGLDRIPVEFLIVEAGLGGGPAHRTALLSNALAQAEALLVGKTAAAAEAEMRAGGMAADEARRLAPHRAFPGGRGSTVIGLDRLTPEALGALLAFYEHRTFAQGALMQINSFDQWGVELGKQMAGSLSAALDGARGAEDRDPSTRAWVARLKNGVAN
ncbi:MAG: glucose-6-phosphate isomerase [Hyphomonadaceae bacterium]